MSLTYPVTLNQVFVHPLAFPENGICEVENDSQYYLYIAVGQWSRGTDVQSNNVAVIPPYQKRAFKANIHNQTPSITLAPSNTPFAFAGTISNSPNVARVSEYSDPKAYFPSQGFEGLAADYIIIAGGRVQANQLGLFASDANNQPAFAVIGQATSWDGQDQLHQGDVEIGRYFSAGKGLYWDNSAGELHVKGTVVVDGGNAITLVGIKGTFTVTDYKTVSWTAVTIFLSDNSTRQITDNNLSQVGTTYLQVSIDPVISPTVIIPGSSPAGFPFVTVGLFIANPNTAEKGTIFLSNGATDIGADRINVQTLSALTANMGELTAGRITSGTIRTNAASVPFVQMDAVGEHILANNTGWVNWLDGLAVEIARIAGWAAQQGASWNTLYWTTNPGRQAAGGQSQINVFGAAQSALINILKTDHILPETFNTDYIQFGLEGSTNGQWTYLNIFRGRVCFFASPVSTLINVLIAGDQTRTPNATLDVAGGSYISGQSQVDGLAKLAKIAVGAVADPGAGNVAIIGTLQNYACAFSDRSVVGAMSDPGTNNLAVAGYANINGHIYGSIANGARAFHSAGQTYTTAVWGIVNLDSTRWDTDNCHSGVGSNARLYAQRAGKYLITFTGEFAANATGVRQAHLRLNSAENIASGTGIGYSSTNASTLATRINVTCVQDMTIGDYVEVFVYQNSGGNLTLSTVSAYSPDLTLIRIA